MAKTLYPNLLEDVYNNVLQSNTFRETWEIALQLIHNNPSYTQIRVRRSFEWHKFRSNVRRKLNKLIEMQVIATKFTSTGRTQIFGPKK